MCLSAQKCIAAASPGMFGTSCTPVTLAQQAICADMQRYARGEEVVKAANTTGNLQVARETLSKKRGLNGSITVAFEWVGNSKVTYSLCAHTKLEAQYV